MLSLIIAFFTSFFVTYSIIKFYKSHKINSDTTVNNPQQIHMGFIPRIGGISIASGILISVMLQKNVYPSYQVGIYILISCIPVFTIGLIEDITNKISVRSRLTITTIGALLAIYLLEIRIQRIDIPYIDLLFTFTVFSYFLQSSL